jgi:hypothetical protein
MAKKCLGMTRARNLLRYSGKHSRLPGWVDPYDIGEKVWDSVMRITVTIHGPPPQGEISAADHEIAGA